MRQEELTQHMLAGLLVRPLETPPPPRVSSTPPPSAFALLRRQFSSVMWYTGLTMLGALTLVIVYAAVSVGASLIGTYRNVQAMYVAPATATNTSIPPTAKPTSTVALVPATQPPPTSTPQPTATTPPTGTPQPTAAPTLAPTPVGGGAITVLLLGSDRRPGEAEPSRTDAIIVARIDPERQRIALLSLPRDLWVTIPGYGQARINAAGAWGEMYNAPGGGPELARRTVSAYLGIPIDYYVYIDFEGFIGAIDSLGGISVNVEKELYDAQFPTMDYQYSVAHFLPGPQQMDGATALTYGRIRHPDNDFARMRRQQAILGAILQQLHDGNGFESVERIETITAALRDYVKTDLPPKRMIGLAWAMRNVSPESVERYMLDANMVTFGVGNDRWAEVAQPGVIEALVRKLLDAST
jgi:LCP family protein required for cell wall assembly